MSEPTSRKGDFALAVLTAAATAIVVSLSEWAVAEVKERIQARAKKPRKSKQATGKPK